MAVAPRDMPVTREMVHEWLKKFDKDKDKPKDFIRAEVDKLDLDDPDVDTRGMEHLPGDKMHVADYILLDLDSYDNAPSS